MELFDDIPEDWRKTSIENIKSLFIDAMLKDFRTHTVLGKVVQHGISIKPVNKYAIYIDFKYKWRSNSEDPSIVGEELDIRFIINRNKPKYKMSVIKYLIYIFPDSGAQIRGFVNEQGVDSNVDELSVYRIIRAMRRTCTQFEHNSILTAYEL